MDRMLRIGSTGPDVEGLQELLNGGPPDQFGPLAVDGMFGPKPSARARDFQRNNNLAADGIVGPKTWAALRLSDQPPARRTGCDCGNSDPSNQPRALQLRQAFLAAPPPAGVKFASFGGGDVSGFTSALTASVP